MKNRNLKDNIQNAMNKNNSTPTFDSQNEFQNHDSNFDAQEDNREFINEEINEEIDEENYLDEERDEEDYEDKKIKKKIEKPLKIFGGFCIAVFLAILIFSGSNSVNTSDAAKNALKEKVSTSLPAGTILLAKDENIGQQDYNIIHSSQNKDTKIWIWDYAAEDGDYVQVLVNGTPISEAFLIKHKPREFVVPATGDIQIKGIKDGGGGITYAVRYELNGTNYFNSAPEGEFNTYTLKKASE